MATSCIEDYFAHTKEGKRPDGWHFLEDHLLNTAKQAHSFAETFGAGEWGYAAGLWHDIGKYSLDFQQRLCAMNDIEGHLETKPGRPDHSSAGAQHAFYLLKDAGKLLAYVIAGHHAGLPDGKSNHRGSLKNRLEKTIPDYSACPERILNAKVRTSLPFKVDNKRISFQISFFIRMLYSCLVDADFLDTEAFMDGERASWRKGYPTLSTLNASLTSTLQNLTRNAPASTINRRRSEILQHCLAAAEWKPGLFSLTVPTGGGKTLASLAFALKHALRYNLERVIFVIPYTSIIEQNADVFRHVVGKNAVLEHHSNFEPKDEDHRSRLAAENWDAPLVVTTNVQFFESLFGSRSSVCRKLHRIARSVVILDEAQMLPVPLLKPTIEVMRELTASYGTSIVLCTATQPALSQSPSFKSGLAGVREMIPNPIDLYNVFRRVNIENLGKFTDEEIEKKLVNYRQVLCVVNTRKHARLLYELLQIQEGVHHLSALMCPAHRTQVLNRIREELRKDLPCRVISTQLIEAGVDIDFPVVFRSAAGIDSLAQAAGRCNREGKIEDGGRVFVFIPEEGLPAGHFRHTAETAEMVMRHHLDPLSIGAVEEYFRNLYWLKGNKLDEYQILDHLADGAGKGDFPFHEIDTKYKIIRNYMEPIIIPWNKEAEEIVHGLRYSEYPASHARKAQRFTIQIPPGTLWHLIAAGSAERIHDQYTVLTNRDIYRDDLGLCPEDPTFHEIENLIL